MTLLDYLIWMFGLDVSFGGLIWKFDFSVVLCVHACFSLLARYQSFLYVFMAPFGGKQKHAHCGNVLDGTHGIILDESMYGFLG